MNEGWSIKLQVNGGGVPLFNEWELVYKSAQTGYKLTQGKMSITGQEPLVVTHQSDSTAAVLARAIEQNKMLALEISILDNVNAAASFDWDTALNNVHTLARHLSGATSTAVRSASGGQNVRIAIKPDTATNTTYYDVQWGKVDTSAAYYTAESQQGSTQVGTKGAWFCPITLTLKDSGYRASFTLRNDLPSSPHMLEDSNADGLPDGWVIRLAATTTINTAYYLTGGKSMRVDSTGGALSGVEIGTGAVTPALGTNISATVWLFVGAGTARVVLRDGADTAIQVVNALPANAIKSTVGAIGNTWYQFHVYGVNVAAGAKLTVDSLDGTGIFYVDNAYLTTGTLAAPQAFCSSSSLKNRYDPANTSAATRQQINYLDVWGVPGDLPALIKTAAAPTTGSGSQYILSKYTDGVNLSANVPYWQDSADYSAGTDTWSTGTGTTDNHYFRLASGTASGRLTRAVDWKYFANMPVVLYAAIRASTTASSISFQVNSLSIFDITTPLTFWQSDAVSVNVVNAWELHNIGLVNLTDITQNDQSKNLYVDLTVTNSGSNTFDFDFVVLLPIGYGDDYLIGKSNIALPAATNIPPILIDGVNEVVRRGADYLKQPFVGRLWSLIPQTTNRMLFLETSQDSATTYNGLTIATDPVITLTVTPRTSHLLGTA